MGKIGAAMKAERNSWGMGTGPGFNDVCFIGPKNTFDNRDRTIRISGWRTEPYDFTAKDVKYVQLLATTTEWVKYKIRFNDGRTFFATLRLKGGRGNGSMPFNVSWLNFECWLRDKIYTGPAAESTDTGLDKEGGSYIPEESFCAEEQDDYSDASYDSPFYGRRQKKELTEEEKKARKKKIRRIAILTPIAFLLVTIIVLTSLYFTAALHFAFTKDGVFTLYTSGYYSYEYGTGYNGVKIKGCSKKSGDLTIPSKILGKQVLGIDGYAFKRCEDLTSVTVSEGVLFIGHEAFDDCTSLTSVTLPESMTSIGEYAFRGCSSLTSVTIPDSVTSIGQNAFENCTSLESIVIPNSVERIGGDVLKRCTSLTTLTIPKAEQMEDPYGNISSFSISKLMGSDSNTKSPLTVIITGGTEISASAFSGCGYLTSVTIPDSVTSIGQDAFRNCSALTTINYAGSTSDWYSIQKDYGWSSSTGNYVIHCTDGDIQE